MPRSFLIKEEKVKYLLTKDVNGVTMYKCCRCGRWKFEEDFNRHPEIITHKYLQFLSGQLKTNCKECEKSKRRQRYKNDPEYRKKTYEANKRYALKKQKRIITEEGKSIIGRNEKREIYHRIKKNLRDIAERHFKIKNSINFEILIGVDDSDYLKLLYFLEESCDKKYNLLNYGISWYCDYDLKDKPLLTREDKIKAFNYKNIIMKKLEKMY